MWPTGWCGYGVVNALLRPSKPGTYWKWPGGLHIGATKRFMSLQSCQHHFNTKPKLVLTVMCPRLLIFWKFFGKLARWSSPSCAVPSRLPCTGLWVRFLVLYNILFIFMHVSQIVLTQLQLLFETPSAYHAYLSHHLLSCTLHYLNS